MRTQYNVISTDDLSNQFTFNVKRNLDGNTVYVNFSVCLINQSYI